MSGIFALEQTPSKPKILRCVLSPEKDSLPSVGNGLVVNPKNLGEGRANNCALRCLIQLRVVTSLATAPAAHGKGIEILCRQKT